MKPARDKVDPLRGARVVLGVSGGIAAYKAAELTRLLIKADATVQAVMTRAAQEFVGAATFQALTGKPVFTDLFDLGQESQIGHIQVADGADLVVIAPATANTIARMSAGLADDALGAVVLATRAPLLLAPSMNVNMWQNPVTQHNLQRLIDRGMRTVGPGSGFLACNWIGPGRMAEPADIVEAAIRVLTPQDLAGVTIAISAGPTREPVDPVRYLSNRSSGKMGYALATAAARRGATVRLVSGPVDLATPHGVDRIDAETAAAMNAAVTDVAAGADVVIMAAAIADFRPANPAGGKLKKHALGDAPSLALERTTDVLAGLGQRRGSARRPLLVGFAAETDDVVAEARRKLDTKSCDLVVANDVSQPDAGFSVDTNRVVIVSREAAEPLELASKLSVAHAILDRAAARL